MPPILGLTILTKKSRTQFHIGTSWNINESAVCRLICKVEKLLMDSGKFRLPGKKQLDRVESREAIKPRPSLLDRSV